MEAAVSLGATLVRAAFTFWALSVLAPLFGFPLNDPWHYLAAALLLGSFTTQVVPVLRRDR